MRTRVKICGVTCPEDAEAAVQLGADAIGLVFCDASPRAVDMKEARAIAAAVPAFVSIVGLFVDPRPGDVEVAVEGLHLDALQFHGNEAPSLCRRFQRRYVKAVPMGSGVDPAAYTADYPDASGFLLDSHRLGELGGRGEAFDHGRIPDGVRGLTVAGGLNPDNVAAVIRQVRPFALDVSSGVEAAPGIKDQDLMARLFAEVERGDET